MNRKISRVLIVVMVLSLTLSGGLFGNASELPSPTVSILQVPSFKITGAQDITIFAEITNYNKVNLFYKSDGQTRYSQVKMRDSVTILGTQEAVIPKIAIESGFVEYYVEATNFSGAVTQSSVQNINLITANQADTDTNVSSTESEIGILATNDYFYDIQYYNGVTPSGYTIPISSLAVKTPTRTSSGGDSYPSVSSKMAEIRSLSPNPHNGVDLSVGGIAVKPVLSGRVIEIGSPGMVVVGHGNYNSSTNTADYYSRYLHMSDIKVTKGQSVTTDTTLGTASDVGSPGAVHLDFSFFVRDGGYNRFMPTKFFYQSTSNWASGKDLDFVQPPVRYYDSAEGTYIQVNAYPKGTRDSSTLTLTMVWREKYTTNWNRSPMYSLGNNEYRFYADPALDGKYIQYYIEITRSGVSGRQYRPMLNGLEGPNKDNPPNIYYEAKVVKGNITATPPSSLD